MKYIRTNDCIYKISKILKNGNLLIKGKFHIDKDDVNKFKQADTIEELFMPNDMLIVGDDKNQMPIFIESIEYLNAWLYCHDIYKIKEFYIKVENDWHLVAKTSDKGEWELL